MFGLKVVGWCSFDSDYPTKKYNEKELKKVLKVVKKEISKNNYSFSGAIHQNSSNGVPVLSDGSCLRCSMRFWGEVMKDVYSKKLKQELIDKLFMYGFKVEINIERYNARISFNDK